MIEAYPLCWPAAYPATAKRKDSRFKTTLGAAREYVKLEIKRIGGTDPIISTNIPLKNDGDLRADWSRYKIDNPGVAVYFIRKNQQVCLCSDTYERVWENLYAVGRTIEALRQISRDGVSDFLDRTFTGFQALPETSSFSEQSIWDVLGLDSLPADIAAIKQAFIKKSKVLHPDMPGGSAAQFHELKTAFEKALTLFQNTNHA